MLFPRVRHQQVAVVVTDFCRVSVYIKFQAGDVADGIPNTDRQASLIVRIRATINYRIGICLDSRWWLYFNACRMQKLLNGFAKNTEILPMNWTSEVVVAGQRSKLDL